MLRVTDGQLVHPAADDHADGCQLGHGEHVLDAQSQFDAVAVQCRDEIYAPNISIELLSKDKSKGKKVKLTKTQHSSQLDEQWLLIFAQFEGFYQRFNGVLGESEASDGVGHGPHKQHGDPGVQKCR